MSRSRDAQIQVGRNYLHVYNLNQDIRQYPKIDALFKFTFLFEGQIKDKG